MQFWNGQRKYEFETYFSRNLNFYLISMNEERLFEGFLLSIIHHEHHAKSCINKSIKKFLYDNVVILVYVLRIKGKLNIIRHRILKHFDAY